MSYQIYVHVRLSVIRYVRWSVMILLKGGNLNFHAPIEALVIYYLHNLSLRHDSASLRPLPPAVTEWLCLRRLLARRRRRDDEGGDILCSELDDGRMLLGCRLLLIKVQNCEYTCPS